MEVIDIEGAEGFVKPLAIFVFFAIFGYAYCTRANTNDSAPSDDFDPTSLKNKDVKVLRKLAEELLQEKERVAKMEDKLKKFDQNFVPASSSNVAKSSTKAIAADSAKSDAPKTDSPKDDLIAKK